MSFFSLDSKFSQIMGRVFDLMMLNIIFLIMCIPIVTIGANFTAMYYVTLKMIKNEETYIFRTYWKSFRENFKQATAIWLILLAVLIASYSAAVTVYSSGSSTSKATVMSASLLTMQLFSTARIGNLSSRSQAFNTLLISFSSFWLML